MLAEEEGASEDVHQDDRTTQDEHLEHLEHLATEEQLAEGEDAQGVQDAQGNHAPEYEQLAMCIHDAPGGCWLPVVCWSGMCGLGSLETDLLNARNMPKFG